MAKLPISKLQFNATNGLTEKELNNLLISNGHLIKTKIIFELIEKLNDVANKNSFAFSSSVTKCEFSDGCYLLNPLLNSDDFVIGAAIYVTANEPNENDTLYVFASAIVAGIFYALLPTKASNGERPKTSFGKWLKDKSTKIWGILKENNATCALLDKIINALSS